MTSKPSWFARATGWLPSSFDRDDRAALVETFDARAAAARARSRIARAFFVTREAGGLLWLIVVSRLTQLMTIPLGDHAQREIRHATRRLRRTPLLTGSAIVMMTIAIGSTTVVSALLYRVVLAPLPYPDAQRLIYLDHDAPGAGVETLGLSIGLFQQYLTLSSIESAALYYAGVQTMTGRGDAMQLPFLHTTTSLGDVLRIRTVLGRWFTDAEGRDVGVDAVVLTHALWRRSFNSDTSAIGAVIQLDGRSHRVIGVLAPDTELPAATAEYVLPLRLPPHYRRAAGFNYEGIARLAPGVAVETALQQQNVVIAEIPERFRGDPELSQGLLAEFRIRSTARLLKDQVLGTSARTLWILFAATMTVLVVAGANLATLFVVRAEARASDSALRSALGAHPWLDAFGAAAEPLLICIAGGGLGLVAAEWALQLLRTSGGLDLPRLGDPGLDARAVAIAVAISISVGAIAGLVSLRRFASNPARLLDAGCRLTDNVYRARARQVVMALQVGFATILLIAASLLLQSARHLRHVDPGFRTDDKLVFRVSLPRGIYRTRASAEAFHARLLGALDNGPLRDASLTTTLPLDGEGIGNPIEINGQPSARVNAMGVVRLRRVSDRYFGAMDIPLRRGRPFDVSDATNGTQAAIINEALAARYFPSEDPLGKQIRPANATDGDGWLTIVGVVGNNVTYGLHEPHPSAQLFVPLIGPVRTDVPAVFSATYVVRTGANPEGSIELARRHVASIDPAVALARPEPLSAVVDRAQARVRTTANALALMAVAAVMLGLIGIYAVVAHNVSRRTAEIGVRMAFGADARRVVAAVAGQSGLTIFAGGAIGAIVAAAASQLLKTLVFGVATTDAVTYVICAGAVIGLSLVACWIPARRAARMDPIDALRR